MAKKGSKDMEPYEITLREANALLQQKNARLNDLLQFLQKPWQPHNTTYIRGRPTPNLQKPSQSLNTTYIRGRPTPNLQKPWQPHNTTYNIPTSNAALPNDIQTLRDENAHWQRENDNLAAMVQAQVNIILQYG
jgi:hypothetical protein